MLEPSSLSVWKHTCVLRAYLRSTDILPRVSNTASLDAANLIDAFVPGSLDEVLKS